jgi:hypothetical protein
MKCYNLTFSGQGLRLIIITLIEIKPMKIYAITLIEVRVVKIYVIILIEVGAVKIYVAAMEVLRKKERLSLPPKLMVF